MLDNLERVVFERLEAAITADTYPEGLLFHGTSEEFAVPLRPGGYDGVLWTSDLPIIAHQYMVDSPGQIGISPHLSYELDQRIRPVPHMPWTEIAELISGISADALDREIDQYGRLKSFRVVEGWPTARECEAYVRDVLGYDIEKSPWVKSRLLEGRSVILPADFKMPSRLFVTVADDLSLLDLREGQEGDLMAPQHNEMSAFRDAEAHGYDGIIINDFAQTEAFGNYGHVSYGLFSSAAAKRQWLDIETVKIALCEEMIDLKVTPDVVAWCDQKRHEYSAVPGSRR